MLFHYTSLDQNGRRRSGQLDAGSLAEARRALLADGKRLVSISEIKKADWLRYQPRSKVSPRTAARFAFELASLLRAGAQIDQALLIQSDGRGPVARLAHDTLLAVENGRTFTQAIRSTAGSSLLLAEFAAAGEAGAGLPALLEDAAGFLEAREKASETLRSAFAYPVFILCLGVAAITVLVLFVAPALAPVIEGAENGAVILALAEVGEWIKGHASVVYLILAALVAGLFLLSRTSAVRAVATRLVWRLPFVGTTAKDLAAGTSVTVLAALLKAGRALEDALDIAARVSGPGMAPCLLATSERLRDGMTAGDAFANADALPQEIRRLVRLGEHTSTLPEALRRGAELCHDRGLERIEKAAASLAPALVIGLGLAIALLMLTVLNSLMAIGSDTF